ncbi:pyridoxal phosphate-dependent transferase [Lasiosphaeria hispida]|uniref:Pyridoxal phosphate-dependent transferase n=1 Tax=Lasiosphaeria hispida TaxID=260671 RepID=A0AAJ0MKQ2_9PEZI|nr:pyridoxal phosphate-dependent transferase [Lasiosphaeria hispida]
MQVRYLNKALARFDSTQVIPIQFVSFTLCVIIGSARLLTFSPSEIPTLEAALAAGTLQLDALFTEFPGNPLLQSPDLARLHALARKYNFVLVVDVMCTSLTKMFSGACNVMGGAVTLSPTSPFTEGLGKALGERVGEFGTLSAEKVDMLLGHPAVAEVYYPEGSASQDVYDRFLSVRFTTPAKAVALYDALDVAKGPSLGTNFC